MKQFKRNLFTLSCAVMVISAMSVAASATGSDNAKYTLNSVLQTLSSNGFNIRPTQDCPVNRPGADCPQQPGTNCPVKPGTDCPVKPGKPVVPEAPELPEIPGNPELPEDKPNPDQPGIDQPDGGSSTAAYAAEVARLVNKERAAAGLSPLTVNAKVQSAAQVRANEQKVSFSHTRPNGSSSFTALTEAGFNYRGAGENIAWGQRTPEQVMTGWMNSSGHRTNIMNAKYTEIGVGCYADSSGTLYWTQLFAY